MWADACSYPGDYREEREGDSSSGCICTLVEWQFISCGPRPLIGQKTETYKVQESPETCQKSVKKNVLQQTKKGNLQVNCTHETADAVVDFSDPEQQFSVP